LTTTPLVDTGPLVAFLNRRDAFHEWASEQMADWPPPLLTCEAVVSEACFLVRDLRGGREAVLSLLREDLIRIDFSLQAERHAIQRLLARYSQMALADACLVRMSEMHTEPLVLTIDSDFRVYRRSGRRVIPAVLPPGR